MATPVFGVSNKRDGFVVVLDDGSVWTRYRTATSYAWQEQVPLPNTPRYFAKSAERATEAPRAD